MSCCWKIGMASRDERVRGCASALHYRAATRSGKTLLGKSRLFNTVDGRDNASKPVMLPGHDTSRRRHGSGNGNGNRTVRHVHRQHGIVLLSARPLTTGFCPIRKARHANGGLFAFCALTYRKRLCTSPQLAVKCPWRSNHGSA